MEGTEVAVDHTESCLEERMAAAVTDLGMAAGTGSEVGDTAAGHNLLSCMAAETDTGFAGDLVVVNRKSRRMQDWSSSVAGQSRPDSGVGAWSPGNGDSDASTAGKERTQKNSIFKE